MDVLLNVYKLTVYENLKIGTHGYLPFPLSNLFSSINRTVVLGLPYNGNNSIAPIFAWTSFVDNASTILFT